jgi:Uncharacterized conserved protein (DUF2285)
MDEGNPSAITPPIDLTALSSDQLRAAPDGWYVVFDRGGATHRLWLNAKPVRPVPYRFGLPADRDFEARARAAQRFLRAMNNRPLGPAFDKLTPQKRAQLVMALRALDGHLDGASYRMIAEVLFGADRIPTRGWKTSDVRSKIIRVVEYGKRMMRGGYRDLLRPPRRKR